MSTSLDGKTALVTGAGRGIGRAVAIGLASTGATVGLVARSHDELAETARRIRESGGIPVVIPGDLGDRDQREQVAKRARDELGTVSILVNNAGIFPFGPTASHTEADFDGVYGVNVKVPFFLVAELAPADGCPREGLDHQCHHDGCPVRPPAMRRPAPSARPQ